MSSGRIDFQRYIPTEMTALNFKVEYSASLPVQPYNKSAYHTVAYRTYLPQINANL